MNSLCGQIVNHIGFVFHIEHFNKGHEISLGIPELLNCDNYNRGSYFTFVSSDTTPHLFDKITFYEITVVTTKNNRLSPHNISH